MTNTENIPHAHVATASADCDGSYSGGHSYWMSKEESADDFAEIHFRNRVLTATISVYATEQATMTVTEDGFEWNERTEEGYRWAEVRWCSDDCEDEQNWRRDHRAEAAGY